MKLLSGEDDSALETEHLEEPNQGRLGNTDWCSEQEQQTLDCITQNSAFYRVVLERELLRTALMANMDRLREPLPNSYDEFYEQGCLHLGFCSILCLASEHNIKTATMKTLLIRVPVPQAHRMCSVSSY